LPDPYPRKNSRRTPRSISLHDIGGQYSYAMSCAFLEMAQVNVRYMVRDVAEAVEFYTTKLGFRLLSNASPAFADVILGDLRLLLAGPASSAGRPMPDGRIPGPGGWNRIELVVPDIEAEVKRLSKEGVKFRNEIVRGPGGAQILAEDPSGNVIELFQPARS